MNILNFGKLWGRGAKLAVCTFFGHRDCPVSIKPKLRSVLIDLIENRDVDMFYVGQQGILDAMVRSVLEDLATVYPHIDYNVVLTRKPKKHEKPTAEDIPHTIFPEGIESVSPRSTLFWHNTWMLERSDYVVTWVTRPWGGAAQFAEVAQMQKKTVINLAAHASKEH